jgi:hypothetical protein
VEQQDIAPISQNSKAIMKTTNQKEETQTKIINPKNAGLKAASKGVGEADKWVDEAGNIKWPANRGFLGESEKVTLEKGTMIDRFGNERGTFVAPKGTPYEMRALPIGTNINQPYNVYEVLKPIDAMGGKAASWFGEPGMGTQYELSGKISDLIKDGYLGRVGK